MPCPVCRNSDVECVPCRGVGLVEGPVDDTPLARAIRNGEGNDQYLWALLRGIARVAERADRTWTCETYWRYTLHRYCPAKVHTPNPEDTESRRYRRRRRVAAQVEDMLRAAELELLAAGAAPGFLGLRPDTRLERVDTGVAPRELPDAGVGDDLGSLHAAGPLAP